MDHACAFFGIKSSSPDTSQPGSAAFPAWHDAPDTVFSSRSNTFIPQSVRSSMELLFAPMEGITDGIFRTTHASVFGGIDHYYIPFISPTVNGHFDRREMRLLFPSDKAFLSAVPQILCKDPSLFLHCTDMLRELGFMEVNLNVGCPSGTVTAKGKGSGMLLDLDSLKRFLDQIYTSASLPVSVKTRIGYVSEDEWPALLDIYKNYPIEKLIIHPRTRQDFYKGPIHRHALESLDDLPFPWIINGDLTTTELIYQAVQQYHCTGVMVGRGFLTNPGLARQIKTGQKMCLSELVTFHDTLFRAYQAELPPNAVLGRMREITKYFSFCFAHSDKAIKRLFKAKSIEQYLDSAALLFSLPFIDDPCYPSSADVES